jgi:MFS transporter, PAT family, beta-lactamase induction signal transducer AmpG
MAGSTRVTSAAPNYRRALAVMAAYGFVAGLPLPLSGFTLRQWMSEGAVSLGVIGLTANIGISYSLKFLWAPLLDRLRPPPFLARFGQRRGWLMMIQPALTLACIALALCDPATPLSLIVAAAAVAFLSASQDIGIDAWRIEMFPERMQGTALAAYIWGYRAALLVAGAAAIGLAGRLGWHGALLGVAALVALGPVVTLLAPSPDSIPVVRARVGGMVAVLRNAVIAPMQEFLSRPHAATTLAFVLLFKLGEAMAGTMAPPFYRSMGFDRAQVALAIGIPSLAASLAGAAVGGFLVARLGAKRALILTGFVQMASMGLYFALAYSGGNPVILVAKVVLEGFAEAMADAAFITFLSSLCAPGYTATQYALLSSLAAIPLRTVGGLSGFLAQGMGWVSFYGLTIFAAVPAMLIMLVLVRRASTVELAARNN